MELVNNENNKLFAVCIQKSSSSFSGLSAWFQFTFDDLFFNQNLCLHLSYLFTKYSKDRSIFSLSGLNYVDSSSIFDPLGDEQQFEDVSQFKKAFCWKYFLLDETNQKAKCKIKMRDGNICNRIISSKACNKHLKQYHGMDNDSLLLLKNKLNKILPFS